MTGERRALVLGYHRIAEDPGVDPWALCVTFRNFEEHLRVVCARFHPASLDAALHHGTADRAVVVTFDDGYGETAVAARALLEKYKVPATLFITTGQVDADREYWWDSLERLLLAPGTLPAQLTFSVEGERHVWKFRETRCYSPAAAAPHRGWRAWINPPPTERHEVYLQTFALFRTLSRSARDAAFEELFRCADESVKPRATHRVATRAELTAIARSGLIDFGSHTVTHSPLALQRADEQRRELAASRTWLEALTGRAPAALAYPFGQQQDYSDETKQIAREVGFTSACANFPGLVTAATGLYDVPRLPVANWTAAEFEQAALHWLA